jgi:hypothetical protein
MDPGYARSHLPIRQGELTRGASSHRNARRQQCQHTFLTLHCYNATRTKELSRSVNTESAIYSRSILLLLHRPVTFSPAFFSSHPAEKAVGIGQSSGINQISRLPPPESVPYYM